MPRQARKSPRDEPDIAAVASLVAEPARARMLSVLMNGQALTATELAAEAGVAPSTASAHLARLERERVLTVVRRGRFRYYRLEDPDVAAVLEGLMGLAAVRASRTFGPRDPALRQARVCFDHLAGTVAVQLADAFCRAGLLAGSSAWTISPEGERFFGRLGVDVRGLETGRRPLVRQCLDWSERRFHVGGALGAALLERIIASGWARREPGTRIVTFTDAGERWLREATMQVAGTGRREVPLAASLRA